MTTPDPRERLERQRKAIGAELIPVDAQLLDHGAKCAQCHKAFRRGDRYGYLRCHDVGGDTYDLIGCVPCVEGR